MGMKAGQLALLGLFALANLNAFGGNQLGYGGTKCALYNSIHSKNVDMSSSMDSWALGYLSGLNQAAVRGGAEDLIGKQQPDRVISFVRGYCKSNLKKTINDAANNYWYDFISR